MIIQTEAFIMPTDPTVVKQIKDACFEISASKTRSEGEKSFQKQAVQDLFDDTKIPKKHLNKIANLYHRSNKNAVVAENEATVELYEHIFPETREVASD